MSNPENKGDRMSEKKQEAEAIREALADVIDPEMGMSVVDLGFIRDIDITDEKVHVTMIFTTPFCPMAQIMLSQVQEAAQGAVDRPVEVTMGDERWSPSMMRRREQAD
jgi:metal-sulfur cluster biosynthetic enzyme